jgi:hypothetical protein
MNSQRLSEMSMLAGMNDDPVRAMLVEQLEQAKFKDNKEFGPDLIAGVGGWLRKKRPNSPETKFFAANNNNPRRVIAALKAKYPDVFREYGLMAPAATKTPQNAAPQTAVQPTAAGSSKWLVGGLVAAGLGAAAWYYKGDDKK